MDSSKTTTPELGVGTPSLFIIKRNRQKTRLTGSANKGSDPMKGCMFLSLSLSIEISGVFISTRSRFGLRRTDGSWVENEMQSRGLTGMEIERDMGERSMRDLIIVEGTTARLMIV